MWICRRVESTASRSLALAGVLTAASLLGGCIYDGAIRVQGTVRGMRAEGAAPLPGARVDLVRSDDRSGSSAFAFAGDDGRYEAVYAFGGMGFLFFVPGDGDPFATFAAEGYRPCKIKVHSDQPLRGVERRPCTSRERFCFEIDVLLARPGEKDGCE